MTQEELTFDSLQRYTKALPVALGYRDLLTRAHSERVVGLAADIGKECDLPTATLNILRIAAAFHDIGKIGTPDRILLKAAPFDEGEWQVMQQHATIGEQIIVATELAGAPAAANIIRHHHEHWDGSGYPDRLAGEEIPLCARIIAIADSYDAMAVTRSYHRARSHGQIMAILDEEDGVKHDPALLRLFRTMIEDSPHRTADSVLN